LGVKSAHGTLKEWRNTSGLYRLRLNGDERFDGRFGVPRSIEITDHLILPFGRARKDDLERIKLSAVAANGIYLTIDVPCVYINVAKKEPLTISDFYRVLGGSDPVAGAGRAGSGRHHHGARSLDAHRPEGRPLTYRRDGSLLTHRWRGESAANSSLKMPNSLLAGSLQGISSIRTSAAPRRQRKRA
jgi:hypothetical protein